VHMPYRCIYIAQLKYVGSSGSSSVFAVPFALPVDKHCYGDGAQWHLSDAQVGILNFA